MNQLDKEVKIIKAKEEAVKWFQIDILTIKTSIITLLIN